MKKVTRTERGWAGHYICSHRCLFRRNTLLSYKNINIVVSTVGALWFEGKIEIIYPDRYYETMAFHSKEDDHIYHDVDTNRPVDFDSQWTISNLNADVEANDMHETVVEEITNKLLKEEIV